MGEKIFKKKFAVELSKDLNISVAAAEDIVNKFIDLLYSELKSGNEVIFSGFGKFYVHKGTKTVAVNPQTGQKISVTPKKKIKFKQSTALSLP